MSWNFETEHFFIRLPVSDTDGAALYELLRHDSAVAHIPRLPMSVSDQPEDELRRVAMRFESREAAYWFIERKNDGQIIARIGIQHINWMMLNAQLQWELADDCELTALQEALPVITEYLMKDLHIQRLEMRLRPHVQRLDGNTHEDYLTELGFEYEGTLPAQLEFDEQDVDLAVYSLINEETVH